MLITQETPSPIVTVQDVEESLLEGDVMIDIEYSTINFKDAMVTQSGNRVARLSPLIGGVDLAGRIVEAPDDKFALGDRVVVHGRGLGVSHHGGFAQRARVPLDWVVPLPKALSTRSAMIAGTAGFTAMASLIKLEASGLRPGQGPVLVTGATGGVGSTAVALLTQAGYEVVASTGKSSESEFLRSLGAVDIISRDSIDDKPDRALGSERWAAAVDCVGGATLSAILRSLHYAGAVAASGLTGGAEVSTNVFPFIVRAVSLLGIDAVEMPNEERVGVWERLSTSLSEESLEKIVETQIGLDEVPAKLEQVGNGEIRGRVLICLNEGAN